MKKRLLKLVYLKYKQYFYDFFVEDLYEEIPDKVTLPAMRVIDERKKKLQDWLYFQAFHLSRRIPKDPKNNDMVFGMLLQIKLLLQLIDTNTTSDVEPQKSVNQEKKHDDELETALAGVEKFTQGKK